MFTPSFISPRLLGGIALALLAGSAAAQDNAKLPALIPPVYAQGLRVTVDTSAAPECQAWGERAKAMVELWYPTLSAYLDTPLSGQGAEIRLLFKDMPGVAHTQSGTITIASGWIKSHPEDIGMVVHELVHVVQAYPPSKAGWLVEGIADYIRFWMAEPSGQPKTINRSTDSYRKGYRVTGAFLAWIEQKYQVPVVRDANLALRKGVYTDQLFTDKTGKDLDSLWAEFLAERSPQK